VPCSHHRSMSSKMSTGWLTPGVDRPDGC
jgi:hypothetical protein